MSWCPRQRVVVPVDFSDPSVGALRTAAELVESVQHVHVVHALSVPFPGASGVAFESVGARERRAAIEKLLDELLENEDMIAAEVHVRLGDPWREIVAVAQEVQADLIVMPTHGRSGLSRIMLGSVTEHVVRHATCPVLVLRAHAAN